MIKRVVKIIFSIGVIFGFGLMLSSVFKLAAYNEIFELFDLKSVNTIDYEIKADTTSKNSLIIFYTYQANGTSFERRLDVYDGYFEDNFQLNSDSSLMIRYNASFPKLSFIASLPLEKRKEKVGIVVSSIFLAFISVLYFFGNINKSVKNYEELGKRPWIYPANPDEKNIFKRILGMFFKKPA